MRGLYRAEFKKLTERDTPLTVEIRGLLESAPGLCLNRLFIPVQVCIKTFDTYTSQTYECETLSAIDEFVDWNTMDPNESGELVDKVDNSRVLLGNVGRPSPNRSTAVLHPKSRTPLPLMAHPTLDYGTAKVPISIR